MLRVRVLTVDQVAHSVAEQAYADAADAAAAADPAALPMQSQA